MNAKGHVLGGVVASSVTYLAVSRLLEEQVSLGGLITAALVGVPMGLVLDIAEPATHPNHRGPAHSVAAFVGVAALANHIWQDPNTERATKIWATVALAGIGSHHILDASTPKGLPLTGLRL